MLRSFYDKPLHWCIVPIVACGWLSGIDMTAYLRGKLDAFDPLGVVGLFSYHFFFLAPLLTLLSGYHSKFLPAVPDWNDWIGWMAIINVGQPPALSRESPPLPGAQAIDGMAGAAGIIFYGDFHRLADNACAADIRVC